MGSICIPVLSGHCCGSSAVAGVLAHLGVPMGPRLVPASLANPTGHFEDREFQGLHKRMVADWRHPDPDIACCRKTYRKLVERRERRFPLWGVKNPRMAFTFPLLREFVQGEMRLIRVCRDLQAVARSIEYRARISKTSFLYVYGRSMEIAQLYEAAILAILRDWRGPILFVEYNRLIDHTRQTVETIAQFVGVEPNARAIEFINPKLRHFS